MAPVHWRAVPRNRTARPAVLGVSVRRPAAGQLPSRSTAALRRRLVVGILVVLSLALITVSFRQSDDGTLGTAHNAIATRSEPGEVAIERVARPFRDAWGWFDGLRDAKSKASDAAGGERAASAAGRAEPVRGRRERAPQGAARSTARGRRSRATSKGSPPQ